MRGVPGNGDKRHAFLASRIIQDLEASLFVRLLRKVPGESQFQSKDHEPWQAISLLYYGVKPRENMLREYVKPVLQSTNAGQRFAVMALQQLGFQVIPP